MNVSHGIWLLFVTEMVIELQLLLQNLCNNSSGIDKGNTDDYSLFLT
jgi:hypothetical protein